MVEEGARVADWREAFHYGQAKGDRGLRRSCS